MREGWHPLWWGLVVEYNGNAKGSWSVPMVKWGGKGDGRHMHTVASSLASSMERVSGTDRPSGSKERTDASHRTLFPVSFALKGGGGANHSQHSFHTMRVCHAIESIHVPCSPAYQRVMFAYLVVLSKSGDRDIRRVLIMANIESWPKYFLLWECVCVQIKMHASFFSRRALNKVLIQMNPNVLSRTTNMLFVQPLHHSDSELVWFNRARSMLRSAL